MPYAKVESKKFLPQPLVEGPFTFGEGLTLVTLQVRD